MAKFTIPYLVERKRSAAGPSKWYWQPNKALRTAGWEPMALGSDVKAARALAEAQNEKLEAWRNGGATPRAVKAFAKPATMRKLIQTWKIVLATRVQDGSFAASTLRQYNSNLKTIEAWAGDVAIVHIDRQRVRKLRDALMTPTADGIVRHTMAHSTLRVLRTMMQFAIDEGMLAGANPAERPGLGAPPPRDHIWWTPAKLAFAEAAEAGGYPSVGLAVELAGELGIGQREADILGLTQNQWVTIPAHKLGRDVWLALAEPEADGTLSVRGFRIRQRKTKRWIEVPVVGATRGKVETAIAAARAAGSTMVLMEEARAAVASNGLAARPALPWDATRFQRRVAAIRDAAAATCPELADLQFRDLRRTAVVYLGELGIEDHLIAAITGHSLDTTKKILETYMPRTTGMAARAIALRIERTQAAAPQEKQA